MPSSGLEDPRLERIGDSEAVVIGHRASLEAASSALAVAFEELGDNRNSPLRGPGALQCKAKQIHAGERARRVWLPREDRFVTDRHAVLVCPHLRSPHPERAADQMRTRLRDLRYLDPGAAAGGSRLMRSPRMP